MNNKSIDKKKEIFYYNNTKLNEEIFIIKVFIILFILLLSTIILEAQQYVVEWTAPCNFNDLSLNFSIITSKINIERILFSYGLFIIKPRE